MSEDDSEAQGESSEDSPEVTPKKRISFKSRHTSSGLEHAGDSEQSEPSGQAEPEAVADEPPADPEPRRKMVLRRTTHEDEEPAQAEPEEEAPRKKLDIQKKKPEEPESESEHPDELATDAFEVQSTKAPPSGGGKLKLGLKKSAPEEPAAVAETHDDETAHEETYDEGDEHHEYHEGDEHYEEHEGDEHHEHHEDHEGDEHYEEHEADEHHEYQEGDEHYEEHEGEESEHAEGEKAVAPAKKAGSKRPPLAKVIAIIAAVTVIGIGILYFLLIGLKGAGDKHGKPDDQLAENTESTSQTEENGEADTSTGGGNRQSKSQITADESTDNKGGSGITKPDTSDQSQLIADLQKGYQSRSAKGAGAYAAYDGRRNSEVVAFVENFQVMAVKDSRLGPQLLANKRSYSLNDRVNEPLNVRWVGLNGGANEVVFEDANGALYPKVF